MNNIDNVIATALISDYDQTALININSGEICSNNTGNIFSSYVSGDFAQKNYDEHLDAFLEQLVIQEDKERLRISMQLDLIKDALSGKQVHCIKYRISFNNKIYDYQAKFCNTASETQGLIAIGTCNITSSISDLLHNLDNANKRAKSVTDEKNLFLTNLSHDIKNPIDEVVDMVEMARKNVNDINKVSKYLENMSNESNHLKHLLNDVLDISSLEDNHITILKRPLNISLLAENCVKNASKRIASKQVNLITEFCVFEFPHVLGDEIHLQKVLDNVLDNAIKFTRDGDIIFFRIKDSAPTEDRITYIFEVEDTGMGMRPEFLQHIFDPFSQEYKNSLRTHQGSGLGLTITKKLIELMGGTISVNSTPGIGSKFTITMTFNIDRETERSLSRH
ncbi:MAG: HAMP domain-containing histidine kinase [Lachnospiraceae bacterium]|nr:HAMP domain-containing histidine kinase [Lachnospiraceae bacterium]